MIGVRQKRYYRGEVCEKSETVSYISKYFGIWNNLITFAERKDYSSKTTEDYEKTTTDDLQSAGQCFADGR